LFTGDSYVLSLCASLPLPLLIYTPSRSCHRAQDQQTNSLNRYCHLQRPVRREDLTAPASTSLELKKRTWGDTSDASDASDERRGTSDTSDERRATRDASDASDERRAMSDGRRERRATRATSDASDAGTNLLIYKSPVPTTLNDQQGFNCFFGGRQSLARRARLDNARRRSELS
jgi:hypothetical protein